MSDTIGSLFRNLSFSGSGRNPSNTFSNKQPQRRVKTKVLRGLGKREDDTMQQATPDDPSSNAAASAAAPPTPDSNVSSTRISSIRTRQYSSERKSDLLRLSSAAKSPVPKVPFAKSHRSQSKGHLRDAAFQTNKIRISRSTLIFKWNEQNQSNYSTDKSTSIIKRLEDDFRLNKKFLKYQRLTWLNLYVLLIGIIALQLVDPLYLQTRGGSSSDDNNDSSNTQPRRRRRKISYESSMYFARSVIRLCFQAPIILIWYVFTLRKIAPSIKVMITESDRQKGWLATFEKQLPDLYYWSFQISDHSITNWNRFLQWMLPFLYFSSIPNSHDPHSSSMKNPTRYHNQSLSPMSSMQESRQKSANGNGNNGSDLDHHKNIAHKSHSTHVTSNSMISHLMTLVNLSPQHSQNTATMESTVKDDHHNLNHLSSVASSSSPMTLSPVSSQTMRVSHTMYGGGGQYSYTQLRNQRMAEYEQSYWFNRLGYDSVATYCSFLIGCCILAQTWFSRSPDQEIYMLYFIMVYLFFGIPFQSAFKVTFTLALLFALAMWVRLNSDEWNVNKMQLNIMYLLISNALLTIAAYNIEIGERVDHLASHELTQQQNILENLMDNLLPAHALKRLRQGGGMTSQMNPASPRNGSNNNKSAIVAESFDICTILFSDLVSFTSWASQLRADVLIFRLHELYMAFDRLCEAHDVYKVETIGDAYFVSSGCPIPCDDHADRLVLLGKAMINELGALDWDGYTPRMRIGIHSGPVVAGVVGTYMPRYHLFGQTVLTAEHLESSGVPGYIHISDTAKRCLQNAWFFQFEQRTEQIEFMGERHTTYLVAMTNTYDHIASAQSKATSLLFGQKSKSRRDVTSLRDDSKESSSDMDDDDEDEDENGEEEEMGECSSNPDTPMSEALGDGKNNHFGFFRHDPGSSSKGFSGSLALDADMDVDFKNNNEESSEHSSSKQDDQIQTVFVTNMSSDEDESEDEERDDFGRDVTAEMYAFEAKMDRKMESVDGFA